MTRKKRQQASERMKQIWAKRKAAAVEIDPPATAETPTGELVTLAKIICLMGDLTPAGKQYLVNRFM